MLGKSTYKRLEKRLQAEEILAAGIEGTDREDIIERVLDYLFLF